MLVQSVRAFGRQSPKPRAKILAACALQIIRIRDLHQVRRPPVQIFRLDEVITLNGFHEREFEVSVRPPTLSQFQLGPCIEGGLHWQQFRKPSDFGTQ